MAGKSQIKISDSLEKKIRELAEERMRCMLEQAEDSIADALGIIYEKIISDFYKDYPSPKYYDRTYTTYQAGLDIDTPAPRIENPKARISSNTTRTKNGFCKTIKVKVSSDFMRPIRTRSNQYHDPIGWVFDRTFNKGIHGTAHMFDDGDSSTIGKPFNPRGVKVIRSDRTPAIRWRKSMEGCPAASPQGPSKSAQTSSCPAASPWP